MKRSTPLRTRTPLKRSAPIRRKAVARRRVLSPRCIRRGCNRIARVLDLCKTHSHQEADRLFSLAVRSVGVCQIATQTPCRGSLQCCHLISRRYHAVRWDRRNAVAGCAAHHQYWTAHPLEWDHFCATLFVTVGRWDALKHVALFSDPPDLADVLQELRAVAA